MLYFLLQTAVLNLVTKVTGIIDNLIVAPDGSELVRLIYVAIDA